MLSFNEEYTTNPNDTELVEAMRSLKNSKSLKILHSTNSGMYDRLVSAIAETADMTRPSSIRVIGDKSGELKEFEDSLVKSGTMIRLNEKEFPNSYLYRSDPNDVARTEGDTYICTSGTREDAGPTNNWLHTDDAKNRIYSIMKNTMKGKTMYVVPYWLGPLGSEYGEAGIEITDSLYVVVNLMIITRSGEEAIKEFSRSTRLVIGIHSTGALDPKKRYIAHFPEENMEQGLVLSVNTNYGGNALLSKKCHALRIATYQGRKNGWMAEHMMLIGITNPEGKTTYVSGAFPSSSGKTNLSMLEPPAEFSGKGWKTSLISDDIIWMHERQGALYAINPENGFFGVAPHTSVHTNPNAMDAISHDTIFTNVAVDSHGIPYWEGMRDIPQNLTDWKGHTSTGNEPAAHPNSRFTTPISNYRHLSRDYNNPSGARVSAFLFGGRRKDLIPLVYQAYSWNAGVLVGAMQRVETTAATTGKVGVLRNDPMANRPFVGYNMADYFRHYVEMGKKVSNPPKIFNVDWFRKDQEGRYMWPGYSHNMYVMKWVLDRVNGMGKAIETPIGLVPDPQAFDSGGVPETVMKRLLEVDSHKFLSELEETRPFFESFGKRFPDELWEEYHALQDRLKKSIS
ncbi:Phosphoenolpyruvate carboxykinase [GTP] [Thermoplasmatales archaeon]|nr:Phosphoenolpyruvate carboxykinase [GTP] [Thermoplasmatales archaeon]